MAKREYRIKNPRCWVVRWRGSGPDNNYLAADAGGQSTGRAGAHELPTRAAADAHRCARYYGDDDVRARDYWAIVRRGRAS